MCRPDPINPKLLQGTASLRLRSHGLHVSEHPQQVAAQYLANLIVRVATANQLHGNVGETAHILQLLWEEERYAVEIRADADVVNTSHLHRVVNVVNDER